MQTGSETEEGPALFRASPKNLRIHTKTPLRFYAEVFSSEVDDENRTREPHPYQTCAILADDLRSDDECLFSKQLNHRFRKDDSLPMRY